MKRLSVALVLLPLAALLVGTALALQRDPRVPPAAPRADLGVALQSLRGQDPRRLRPGAQAALVLSERDLEPLLVHLLDRWQQPAAVQVDLHDGTARLRASVKTAAFDRWVNLDLQLRQAGKLPEVEHAHIGALPVPAWAATALLRRVPDRAGMGAEAKLALELLREVRFRPGQLHLTYVWYGDMASRVGGALLPPAEQQRLKPYAYKLAQLAAEPDREVSIARLLPPLFELAQQRTASGEDATRENRAAILSLAMLANERRFGPRLHGAPHAPPPHVTLAGREDLAQHFLISAMLTLEAGTAMADAIGLFKEVDDARVGSGFSFNDIAAGHAGSRFAELAASAPLQLQRIVAAGIGEAELIPEVGDLPEFMPQREFQRRFGGVGAPAYARMMAQIEARLDALPLAARVAAAR